jgi:hypothetical protein
MFQEVLQCSAQPSGSGRTSAINHHPLPLRDCCAALDCRIALSFSINHSLDRTHPSQRLDRSYMSATPPVMPRPASPLPASPSASPCVETTAAPTANNGAETTTPDEQQAPGVESTAAPTASNGAETTTPDEQQAPGVESTTPATASNAKRKPPRQMSNRHPA